MNRGFACSTPSCVSKSSFVPEELPVVATVAQQEDWGKRKGRQFGQLGPQCVNCRMASRIFAAVTVDARILIRVVLGLLDDSML